MKDKRVKVKEERRRIPRERKNKEAKEEEEMKVMGGKSKCEGV